MTFKIRAGQREFELGVWKHRISGFLARRQYGKTTIAGRIALKKMMKVAGHTVIFGSVKVDLGREIIRKEAAALYAAFKLLTAQADQAKTKLQLADDKDHLLSALSADDFAELYEASRLELRLYHDRTTYSRTKVVALTPDAVGETGDAILDEVGRCKRFQEVWEAMKPIISSNPEYRAIFTTTPPPDDTHYSFNLLAPPIDAKLPVNPKGNWYRSDEGLWVLRVTAEDAFADGIPLFDDDSGEAISPADSRARDRDKDAWDRNYGCKFVLGGTSACSLLHLDTAQRRGIGHCQFFQVSNPGDFQLALRFIREKLGRGRVGLGADLATTEKATSNPTAVSVVEQSGVESIVRAIITWKTQDDELALERFKQIAQAVKERPEGGPARKLCIDGTNERYFANRVKREMAGILPVEVVVGSETWEQEGREPMTMKQFLGSVLVSELDDNHLWLPPEKYVKEDWRLVRKERGAFVCEPDGAGRHGDTFDSTKLGRRALGGKSGEIRAAGASVGGLQQGKSQGIWKNPYASKFESRGAKLYA